MSICIASCSLGSSNTGIPSGAKPFGVPVAMVVVPLYAEDGTANQIDLSTVTFNQAYLDALINQSDASKRWYPIIGLENVESVKAENIFETFNSGNTQLIAEGVRNFTSILPGKPHEYLKQIKNFSCQSIGVYLVDDCGNFLGSHRVDGFLKPLRIARNSWSTILQWATDTTGQNITLAFNFDKSERDDEMRMILSASISADLDAIDGLIDVTLANDVLSIADDTLAFDAETLYGNVLSPIKYEALVLADFTCLLNAGAETIVSVTETDGSYVLQLTSDILALDETVLSVSKDGIYVTAITTVAS